MATGQRPWASLLRSGLLLAPSQGLRRTIQPVLRPTNTTTSRFPQFFPAISYLSGGQRFKSTTAHRANSRSQSTADAPAKFTEKVENIGKKRNNVRRVVTTPNSISTHLDDAPSPESLDPATANHPETLLARHKYLNMPKCIAVSTAESYNLHLLLPHLQRLFTITPVTSDVYHLKCPTFVPEVTPMDTDHTSPFPCPPGEGVHPHGHMNTHSPQLPPHWVNSATTGNPARKRNLFEEEGDHHLEASNATTSIPSNSTTAAHEGQDRPQQQHMGDHAEVPVSSATPPSHSGETPHHLSAPGVSDYGRTTTPSALFPEAFVPMIPTDGEIFLFQSGAFVSWGLSTHQVERFLREVIEAVPGAETGKYDDVEFEDAPYRADSASSHLTTGMSGDTIMVGATPDPLLAKLAFSHGVARSAKLAVLEDLLDRYLRSMAKVPRILQRGQKIPWSRSQVLQQLGELLHFRMMLNLHSESFLDTPDYYWTKPQLEAYYDAICRNLDINSRTRILNTKLDYANELAAVLREQLSETHSLNLEWCIILLITVEVCFELIHYWEKYRDAEQASASSASASESESESESA